MKIDIKAKNIELTTPLYNYIVEKISSLERLTQKWEADGVVEARVEVERTSKHHHKGPVYFAEINLHLPGRVFHSEQTDWDIRIAVDKARDELQREIKKYKELRPTESKRTMKEFRKLRGKE